MVKYKGGEVGINKSEETYKKKDNEEAKEKDGED